jgi:hypothetical protein
LVVALAASCRSFDEVVVVVLQPIEEAEVAEEEEVAAAVVVEVVLSRQDLNLNDGYFVMIDNSIHPQFVTK